MKLFHGSVSVSNQQLTPGNEVDKMVGANLRVLRQAQGLSVERLAALVGIDPNEIALFETGAVRPTSRIMFGLVNALGASISSCFEEAMITQKDSSILVH